MIKTYSTDYILKDQRIEKNYTFNNITILSCKINYPKVISGYNSMFCFRFNAHNTKNALNQLFYSNSKIYPEAIENFKYSTSNGYPVMNYEYQSDYTVTYNKNCSLSMYFDVYEYMGGAHGNTVRHSENWDGNNSTMYFLKDVFPCIKNYKAKILDIINKQIQKEIIQEGNHYFENYKELTDQYFNEKNFYIINDGIMVYYQQYEIAPYVRGIPEYKITNEEMSIQMPLCLKNETSTVFQIE